MCVCVFQDLLQCSCDAVDVVEAASKQSPPPPPSVNVSHPSLPIITVHDCSLLSDALTLVCISCVFHAVCLLRSCLHHSFLPAWKAFSACMSTAAQMPMPLQQGPPSLRMMPCVCCESCLARNLHRIRWDCSTGPPAPVTQVHPLANDTALTVTMWGSSVSLISRTALSPSKPSTPPPKSNQHKTFRPLPTGFCLKMAESLVCGCSQSPSSRGLTAALTESSHYLNDSPTDSFVLLASNLLMPAIGKVLTVSGVWLQCVLVPQYYPPPPPAPVIEYILADGTVAPSPPPPPAKPVVFVCASPPPPRSPPPPPANEDVVSSPPKFCMTTLRLIQTLCLPS